MKVSLSAIADHASMDRDGKLNVNGVFDRLRTSALPARHPNMVFVLQLRADWEDQEREHQVQVSLEDQDGRKALTIEGKVQVPKIEPGDWKHISQVFALRDIVFMQEGTHLFRIMVDGVPARDHPFKVELISPNNPPPEQPSK